MGFFDFFKKLFGKNSQKNDPLKSFFLPSVYTKIKPGFEEIFETAKALSNNDPEVTNAVRFAIDEPVKYFRENAQRYLDRGIDFDNEHFADEFIEYDLLELASIDELKSRGYVSRVNLECELDEFRAALTEIKGYEKIKDIARNFDFNPDGDIVIWTEELNAELGGIAYIAFIVEMVEETIAVAITDRETSEKINGDIPDN